MADEEQIQLSENNNSILSYNVISDKLYIIWVMKDNSLNLNKGDNMFIITVKTNNNFNSGDVINLEVANDPSSELADPNAIPIDNSVLSIPRIEFLTTTGIQDMEESTDYFEVYPNPADKFVDLSYYINNDESVNISLYNSIGEIVMNFDNGFKSKGKYSKHLNISDLPAGMYSFRMILNNNRIINKKIVISR